MAELVFGVPLRALDANGNPVPGAELRAFREGTSTPLTIYADNAGATAHPVPLEADGNGVFPPIFNTSAFRVKIEIRDPVTNALLPGYPIDGALAGQISAQAASGVSFAPTADIPATNVQDAIQQLATDLRSFEFIATADAANDATMDFTGFDASKYDAYLFVLQNIEPATDGSILYLRTSTDGGSNYDSGASDYAWIRRATSASITAQSGDDADSEIEISAGVGTAAGEKGISGEVRIFGPHLAKQTSIRASIDYVNNGGTYEMRELVGFRNAEENVNAVRFLMSAGNISSGTITFYGMRNG